MRWSDIPFHPSEKTLRQFAGIWLAFFGALAAWQNFVHHRPTLGLVLAALALTVGPLGLVRPRWVGPVYVGWMVLAFPIGWTVSHLVLALVYFGLFTPLALFFRIRGRDPLRRRRDPGAASYYIPKEPADAASYFRQY
jgi:hypothetical protein